MNASAVAPRWKSFLLPAAIAGSLVAILAAGRAFGGPAVKGHPVESSAAAAEEPAVVLVGGYGCTVTAYPIIVPPEPPPGDDPAPEVGDPAAVTSTRDDPPRYVELSHSVGVTASGGVTPLSSGQPGPPPAAGGPGFGGRGPFVGGTIPTPLVTPGMGVGGTFSGGSIEDCARFAEAVLETARGQGCVASEIRSRPPIPAFIVQQESLSFSFVCEGPASAAIHTIGEVNRAVVRQSIQPVP